MDIGTGKPTPDGARGGPPPPGRRRRSRRPLSRRALPHRGRSAAIADDPARAGGCRWSWAAPGSTSARSSRACTPRRPPIPRCRRELASIAAREGSAALHARLAALDPAAARAASSQRPRPRRSGRSRSRCARAPARAEPRSGGAARGAVAACRHGRPHAASAAALNAAPGRSRARRWSTGGMMDEVQAAARAGLRRGAAGDAGDRLPAVRGGRARAARTAADGARAHESATPAATPSGR